MAPRDMAGRPRVYIMIRRGMTTMTRVLDLAYLGNEPIAVISWIRRDGRLAPSRYVRLDSTKLRKAAPAGAFQYDGIADDPL